jgi:hypothetical protein
MVGGSAWSLASRCLGVTEAALDGGTDVGHLDVAEDELDGDDLLAFPGHGNFVVRVAKKKERHEGSTERE